MSLGPEGSVGPEEVREEGSEEAPAPAPAPSAPPTRVVWTPSAMWAATGAGAPGPCAPARECEHCTMGRPKQTISLGVECSFVVVVAIMSRLRGIYHLETCI